MPHKAAPKTHPTTVKLATSLAVAYAIILVAEALFLVYESVGHHGAIGAENLNKTQAKGLGFVAILLVLGAVALTGGAYRLYKQKHRALLATPLIILLVIGTIGQTADMVGSASTGSDIVGFGILLLALIPVILIFLPVSNTWFSSK